MEYLACEVMGIYGEITAPIHELGHVIFGAGLVWLLRKEPFVYPVGIVQVAAALYASSYQGDFSEGGFQHRAAQVIWLLAASAAFVVIIAAFITARREKTAEEGRATGRILAEINHYHRQAIRRQEIGRQADKRQVLRGIQ